MSGDEDDAIVFHAKVTAHIIQNPEAGFQYAVDQVKRIFVPG